MDDNVFNRIFSAATGVWTLVLMAAVALFKAWPHILGRLNERRRDVATEKAGDWDRVRAERDHALEARDHWHSEFTRCECERNEWMRRAITAEATLEGRGRARNEAQAILSAERENDAKKRSEGGGK